MTRLRAAIALCAMVVLFAVLGPYSPGEEQVTKPGPIAAADAIQDAIPDAVAEPASDPLLPVDAIADLTLEQRVGQLFMVGTPVARASAETLDAVASRFAGGVFLHGRSSKGVEATAREAARLRAVAQSESLGIPLWIATDQEGGEVQVLSGQGFDGIPYARDQAERDAATLRDDAGRWGEQLRAAGVTMNLAPVADIVTSRKAARKNAPIGALWREYGYDEAAVAAKAGAFAAGMRDAGVMPTFKHFPGLGRVTGNTDYSADVVDTVVAAGSPDVEVYRTLTAQGRSVVMVGTAVYEKIDAKRPAVFSPAVVTGILRGELGFEGVVTTDDLSATAQVEKWTPAERAVSAIAAGVDLVLVSADPSVFPEMYDAVLAEATSDAAFAEKVDDAARRIVDAKGRKAPGGRP